jgi:hypothetical protein
MNRPSDLEPLIHASFSTALLSHCYFPKVNCLVADRYLFSETAFPSFHSFISALKKLYSSWLR